MITMTLIIILGLIYNVYLSYPTILFNIKPKHDKMALLNQLQMYNVIDDNDFDKMNIDIENIDSRNNSLFSPSSLFKTGEFIDDDDMSIISSICDGIDVMDNDNNDDASSNSNSTRSSIYLKKRNSSQISLNTTTPNTENSTVNSKKYLHAASIYHYPKDSLDSFYTSMQKTINTITGFLKFESDNNIENQDLLTGRTTTTKAVNLMRSNSKL